MALEETCTGAWATPSRYGVIVWLVIALSPLLLAGVHVTCAELVAGRAATPVGADGTTGFSGVTAFDAAESGPVPLALTAATRKV